MSTKLPICGHIQYAGELIEIIDCKSWQLVDRIPTCKTGHDLSACDSCEHRISRNGNYLDPPVIGTREPDPSPVRVPVDPVDDSDHFRGLGDVVAAVTKTLGIKTCGGCAKRREALNKLVPFKNENPGAPAQHPAGDAPGEKSDG